MKTLLLEAIRLKPFKIGAIPSGVLANPLTPYAKSAHGSTDGPRLEGSSPSIVDQRGAEADVNATFKARHDVPRTQPETRYAIERLRNLRKNFARGRHNTTVADREPIKPFPLEKRKEILAIYNKWKPK